MFYTLKINAVYGGGPAGKAKKEVTITYNKDPHHGKIHFIALDHKMASNIYCRKTGYHQADKYRIEITCYDSEQNVTYLNEREVSYKNLSVYTGPAGKVRDQKIPAIAD